MGNGTPVMKRHPEAAKMRSGLMHGATATAKSIAYDHQRGPIDRAHLARYTLGSLPLEIEVLCLFANQVPITLGELRLATTDKEWRDAAHTLKGSARAVGAWQIADCAEAAETLKCCHDAGARSKAVEALARAVDTAVRYIEELDDSP